MTVSKPLFSYKCRILAKDEVAVGHGPKSAVQNLLSMIFFNSHFAETKRSKQDANMPRAVDHIGFGMPTCQELLIATYQPNNLPLVRNPQGKASPVRGGGLWGDRGWNDWNANHQQVECSLMLPWIEPWLQWHTFHEEKRSTGIDCDMQPWCFYTSKPFIPLSFDSGRLQSPLIPYHLPHPICLIHTNPLQWLQSSSAGLISEASQPSQGTGRPVQLTDHWW